MNNERYNQIINEVYSIFLSEATSIKEGYECGDILGSQRHIEEMFSNPNTLTILPQEEFIDKCKTDQEFSERWGLKIEERELSFEERIDLALKWGYDSFDLDIAIGNSEDALTDYGIPQRIITLTYQNETIEVYI